MRAGNVLLVLQENTTYRASPVWFAGNPLTPVDLTGCTARMQFRADYDSPVLLDIGTTPGESGSITLGGLSGGVSFHIDKAAIPVGKGVFDLKIYHSNGDESRFLEGPWITSRGVTR
jgi:hypothetical protein